MRIGKRGGTIRYASKYCNARGGKRDAWVEGPREECLTPSYPSVMKFGELVISVLSQNQINVRPGVTDGLAARHVRVV